MKDIIVELIRRFAPLSSSMSGRGFTPTTGKWVHWNEIEDAWRVLFLADPGAGKTFEVLERARKIKKRGKKAFFIRIERIDSEFDRAFEVGCTSEFEVWLSSTEEAWFFLDSVDEAQLETPRALENAIRIFGSRIHDARERAHIFITSRQDAWQALPDRTLIEQYLPHGAPPDVESEKDTDRSNDPLLKVYWLTGLKLDQIKLFASHYGVDDVNAFVDAIQCGNLMPLAERPFDLKALIRKWQADRKLGSRLDVLRRLIELQLAPLCAAAAKPRVEVEKARAAAQALAAAVTLTGKAIICLPNGVRSPDRIDPITVLPDWSEAELSALLRTGVFDDIVYTSVRVRHREIRELLTAEWAYHLLARPGGRPKVEAIFFREKYGERVIVPRLRPVLTWLLLLDEGIRDRALAIEPEIASEGGDPSKLPLPIRKAMLRDIVERIVAGKE